MSRSGIPKTTRGLHSRGRELKDRGINHHYMKISDLKLDAHNANKGTARGRQAVAQSFKDYGAGRSILIDKHGTVIAGNKSLEAASAAGINDVIVVQSDGTQIIAVQRTDLDLESDTKAKQLAIADNRCGEIGLEWDPEILGQLASEMDLLAFWDADELAALLGSETVLLVDEDDVPPVPDEPKSKLGDVYVLGNHRLMCGDSTCITDVEKLMDGEKADMVWTDPPYNVALGMDETPEEAKKRNRRTDGLVVKNDHMPDEQFRQFLSDAFTSMFTVVNDGGAIYVAHADSEGYNFRGAMRDAGWMTKQCLIWVKSSLVMGRQDYQWKHEPILYGWKPGAAHTWSSDRTQTTVLEFPKPSRNGEHPTMKPVALIEYCIGNSSKAGQKILDLFGGSGSTLIACEKTGRRCRMMELDPKYVDVILARWEAATGKKAERL